MTMKLGHVSLLGDNAYPLFARFTTVTGLRTGSLVYISGIEVGRVEKLTMDQEKQKAMVELRIRNDMPNPAASSGEYTYTDAAGIEPA